MKPLENPILETGNLCTLILIYVLQNQTIFQAAHV